jgi:hypothetical protein
VVQVDVNAEDKRQARERDSGEPLANAPPARMDKNVALSCCESFTDVFKPSQQISSSLTVR